MFVLPSPDTMKGISDNFRSLGGLPGVMGAVDGSYILIEAPIETPADSIDGTQRHTVNLTATCVFTRIKQNSFLQVGFPWSAHDNRVLTSTSLYTKMQEDNARYFPSQNYHLVGDSALALHKHLMLPFKSREGLSPAHLRFNPKLSSSRVTLENEVEV